MINKLRAMWGNILNNSFSLSKIEQILIHSKIEEIKQESRYQDNRNLILFGYKIYSQNDEDGIIHEIFNRVGLTNKVFVEFGVGDGLENNTLALLFEEWSGLWIEGSIQSVNKIRENFKSVISDGRLKVVNSFITIDNIDALISSVIQEKEVDLLSVDIDGNDFNVLDAIKCISPRVIVLEYNAKFRPHISYCMKYNASHVWNHDDNFGASLKYLELELSNKGYCLVGCGLAGVNAFFVRNDLVRNEFIQPFTAEIHYEPARYYLSGYPSGHKPSYKTLAGALRKRGA